MIEFINGFKLLLVYFLVCATSALLLRRSVSVPKEVFRKTLHLILIGSILIFTYSFETWWVSAVAAIVFIVIVFPILSYAEQIPGYCELLTERKRGEIKMSLVVVFSMFAVLISICWGWIGEKYLVIASVFAWGFGDAAAALVGKRFGRRYIEGKYVEGRKSLEGTLAMFVVSFFSVLIILYANEIGNWPGYITISVVTAAVCAVVELFTKGGMDTLTCPIAAAAIMIPMIRIFGG